jgi:TolB protein
MLAGGSSYVVAQESSDPPDPRELGQPVDYWNPSHSPDGAQILFESNLDGEETLDLYVMQADGGGLALLREDAQSPVWSPDGKGIAFSQPDGGDEEIFTIRADGTHLTRLTAHAGLDRLPNWSPDGRRIVFISEQDRRRGVFVMNDDGSNPHRLTP